MAYWPVQQDCGAEVTDLYKSPVQVLRREIDYLKDRLRQERSEVAGLEEKLGRDRSEGLIKLIDICQRDVDATAALIARYRKAIRTLEGK